MSIAPGTRLGPYEIVEPLGAGGMGEVYRARDARLNRDVALKLLPDAVAADKDRLARFRREAQVLASLNHPHIGAIHGLEEVDGKPFLVLELVEGEDLAERVRRGSIPIDDALEIARQIAEALEEAHEKGIVHRDLKPANVKLTSEGKVKVLDFGLAKAFDTGTAGSGPQLAHSPTMSLQGTEAGVILGTAAYMSPEQARGKPVDRRTDIWAFGTLVYECLTGKRVFQGETVSDILVEVLKKDVDFGALPEGVPSSIRALLRRCLIRDPRQRLRDIGEARLVIAEALAGGGELREPVPGPRPRAVSKARMTVVAGGLLAVGAAGQWLALRGREAPAESPPAFALRRLTELPGPERYPDISPDGRNLIYTSGPEGGRDVHLLRVGGDRAINLTAGAPGDDEQAAFSPDGETIAFRSARDGGGLFVMGATGESVRRVTTAGYDPAWSPDGRFLAYSTVAADDPYGRPAVAELSTVEIATGQVRRLVKGDAVQPAWSPAGERIAYWSNTQGQRDIWTVPATGGGEPVPVTQDAATDWSPEWSPDGRWLYFSSDRGGSMNIWRIRVDVASGRTEGDSQPVTSSVRSLASARFAADGRRLVATAYDNIAELSIYDVAAEGKDTLRLTATLRPRSAHWCAPSSGGDWLACVTTGVPEDIVLLRTDGSELRRLTNDPHKDRHSVWSPDGQSLAFYSTRGGAFDYWAIRQDGSGLRQLTEFGRVNETIWSPTGKEMIVLANDADLWRVDATRLTGPGSAVRLQGPPTASLFYPGAWSPHLDRVAGVEGDSARNALKLGVWDLGTGAYRALTVPTAGISWRAVAGWLPDSRRFIARSAQGVVLVDAVDGTWRVIAPCGPNAYMRLSPDSRTLVVEHSVLDSDIWMLESK